MTENILHKVRKLIDKASGTDSEPERDALLEKAGQWMERHAITQAQLESISQTEAREPVAIRVAFPITNKIGQSAMGSLACVIAQTSRCQVRGAHIYVNKETGDQLPETAQPDFWSNYKRVTGYTFQGMPEDAQFCELLWTSLALQCEQGLNEAIRLGKKPEWTHGRTYRANFFEGFRARVSSRLREQAQRRDDEREAGCALVLAAPMARIEEKFGRVRYGSRSVNTQYCGAAKQDGGRAGASADLSGGSRRGLGNRAGLNA